MSDLRSLIANICYVEEGMLFDSATGRDITNGHGDVITGEHNSKAVWVLFTGEMPVGDIFFVEDRDDPYFHSNMIDTKRMEYANGKNVSEEEQEEFGLEVSNPRMNYQKEPEVSDDLPLGVTKLQNGKYRFKRNVKRYGMKLDRVDESLNYIKQVARNFETTLQHRKSTELETNDVLTGKITHKEKNIHKRGNQYYVEFVIDGELIVPSVTYDFDEAVTARDKFLEERFRIKNEKTEEKRKEKLKPFLKDFSTTITDYDRLKECMQYINHNEFNSEISKLIIGKRRHDVH